MIPRASLFRISFANATLLSGLYLLVAAAVEILRRTVNPRWVESVAQALESIPARALQLLGLFEPLRQAWKAGRISAVEVRLVYGLTTVAVIFILGFAVGVVMALIARLSDRNRSRL